VATGVGGDDMIVIAKKLDLGLPHAAVEGETVEEDDRLSLAGAVIVEAYVVEVGVRHGGNLHGNFYKDSAKSILPSVTETCTPETCRTQVNKTGVDTGDR